MYYVYTTEGTSYYLCTRRGMTLQETTTYCQANKARSYLFVFHESRPVNRGQSLDDALSCRLETIQDEEEN